MAPLPSLPAQFVDIKLKLQATDKTDRLDIVGVHRYLDQVVKTSILNFYPNSVLEFENLNFPWLIIYADLLEF